MSVEHNTQKEEERCSALYILGGRVAGKSEFTL